MIDDNHKRLLTSLTLAILLVPAAAGAQARQSSYEDKVLAVLEPVAGGLTSDDVARAATQTTPSIAARNAEIDLAIAGRNRTLARFLPQLSLTASVRHTNPTDFDFGAGALAVGAFNPGLLTVGACPDGGGGSCVLDGAGSPVGAAEAEPFEIPRTNYTLDASVNVPISDYLLSLRSARRASAADINAAELRRAGEVEQVGLDARIAYYEWLRARAQVAVAKHALSSTLARLDDARIGLASGTLASVDILQIESLEASSRVAVIDAESFEELARVNLATLMGVTGDQFSVGEDVRADIAATGSPMSLEELVDHARGHRPELGGLSESVRSAKEAARSTASELYPRLEAVANVTHANPNPQFFPPEAAWNTSWFVGLSLSWSVDRFFEGRAQKKELDANARLFAAQRASLVRAVTLEVTSAWQSWHRASSAVALSRKDLEAAEAAYSQRVALYQAGEATTTEILEVEVQRFDASLGSINARIDVRIARARLNRAAALGDREVAGPPVPGGPPGGAP